MRWLRYWASKSVIKKRSINQFPNVDVEMDNLEHLRSIDSTQEAFVAVTNRTQRIVDAYWIDYHGQPVLYSSLVPTQRTCLNTFTTHPWVFIDRTSGELMQVEKADYFIPGGELYIDHVPEGGVRLTRQLISIDFPMRSLRENARWVVVKEVVKSESQVNEWEIPRILQTEIKVAYRKFLKHRKSTNKQSLGESSNLP